MKEIILFLSLLKKLANYGIEKQLRFTLVMGNTTADLDSIISACVLAYLRNIESGTLSKELQVNPNATDIYLPIVNCKKGTLFHRFDIELLFKTLNAEEENLIYSNQIELGHCENHVVIDYEYFKFNNPKLILVDHHDLDKKQTNFAQFITEIYDHHSDDGFNFKIYPQLQSKIVLFPRCSALSVVIEACAKKYGSVSSLLNEVALSPKEKNFSDFLLAPLIVDSSSFKKKTKNIRWIEPDYDIAFEIGQHLTRTLIANDSLNQINVKDVCKIICKKLKKAKKDVSKNLKLGLDSLLRKDLKIYSIEDKKISVSFSSIPISFESIASIHKMNEIEESFRNISEQEEVDVVMAKMDFGNESLYYLNYISTSSTLNNVSDFSNGLIEFINNYFTDFKAVFAQNPLTNSLIAFETNLVLSRKLYWPCYKKYIEQLK